VLSFVKVLFNSAQFNNAIKFFYKIVAIPGVIRFGNNTYAGAYTNDTIKIMSHGRPSSSTFQLVNTSPALVAIGQEVDVLIRF
jgi:hypothetical protein